MYLKLSILTVLTIVCNACFSADSDNHSKLKISGFRQGLIKFDSNRDPIIYKQGNNFPYKINGTCVAAGRETLCQWHGFEFDYVSPEDFTEINCVAISSRPQNNVDPRAIVEKYTTSAQWGFSFEGRSGHYIRPQYTFDVKYSPIHMESSCSYKGQEVLHWQLTLLPPTNTDFNNRVAEAMSASASGEGQRYDQGLLPYVNKVMQPCNPPGSTSNLGTFTLVGRVAKSGVVSSVEVQPSTKVSECFATKFRQLNLPKPPASLALKSGVPIFVEMTVTP